MPYHLVTYDIRSLNSSEYDELYKTLRSFSDWAWVAQSVWIIAGTDSRQVFNAINFHLRANDTLIVTEITSSLCSKNINQPAQQWLDARFTCPTRAGGLLQDLGLGSFGMLPVKR